MHVGPHLLVHPFGGAAHSDLTQGGQVAFAKEFLDGPCRLLRHIHLTLAQPLQKFIRGQVNQLDFRGRVNHPVRQGFPNDDLGDLGHDIVEALQVLDVEGGVNIYPGGQEFFDILIPFGVTGAGGVGVGQFVYEDELRPPRQHRIQVHFRQGCTPVGDLLAGDEFQPGNQVLRLGPVMGFHVPDDNIHPSSLALVGGLQHGIGLAHPGHIPEEDFHAAAFFLRFFSLDMGEQLVGVGTLVRHKGAVNSEQ